MFKVFFNRNRSFFDFVYKEIEQKDIRESTKYNLMNQLKRIKQTNLFNKFKDINRDNVLLFNKKMKECDYKQIYINNLNTFIRHFIKIAISKGFISENPYETIKLKKERTITKKYLTADVLKK